MTRFMYKKNPHIWKTWVSGAGHYTPIVWRLKLSLYIKYDLIFISLRSLFVVCRFSQTVPIPTFSCALSIFALFVSQSYRMYKVSSRLLRCWQCAKSREQFECPQPPVGLRYIRLQGIMGNDGHKVRSHSFSRSLINSWPQICAARGSPCRPRVSHVLYAEPQKCFLTFSLWLPFHLCITSADGVKSS